MKRVLGIVLILLLTGFLSLYLYLPYNLPEMEPNHADPDWNRGPVLHLLPTASHRRFLLKVSFERTFSSPPRLRVDGRRVPGRRTDTKGAFWAFHVKNLEPGTEYRPRLETARGRPLTDPWPLSTFPDPQARPDSLRLMVYSCAGGHDAHREWFGVGPLPLAARKKLLNRGLSLDPDVVVSTGDQIYYDLRYGKSARVMGQSPKSRVYAGTFDPSLGVLGTKNEDVLRRAVSPQIAYLYGTQLRSTPAFFLLDDHDYFENDVAKKGWGFDYRLLLLGWRNPFYRGGLSFPPDEWMLRLGRTAQDLYLPEFLPDPHRPDDLPGASAPQRAPGVSETYGTLRYGKLLEGLLYEGRRYLTLSGTEAVFVHPEAERWLTDRMDAEAATHVMNLPTLPYGWSAGKWLEWYPDVRGKDGNLTTDRAKYRWQEGWFRQHNRLLRAAARMDHTLPLFVAGDLHSQAVGLIRRSGDLSFRGEPIVSVISGSLGAGPRMWPSAFRDMRARPPTHLEVTERLSPLEKNGFVIVDLTPRDVTIQFFAWDPSQPLSAIENLEPHYEVTMTVPEAEERVRRFRDRADGFGETGR